MGDIERIQKTLALQPTIIQPKPWGDRQRKPKEERAQDESSHDSVELSHTEEESGEPSKKTGHSSQPLDAESDGLDISA